MELHLIYIAKVSLYSKYRACFSFKSSSRILMFSSCRCSLQVFGLFFIILVNDEILNRNFFVTTANTEREKDRQKEKERESIVS